MITAVCIVKARLIDPFILTDSKCNKYCPYFQTIQAYIHYTYTTITTRPNATKTLFYFQFKEISLRFYINICNNKHNK